MQESLTKQRQRIYTSSITIMTIKEKIKSPNLRRSKSKEKEKELVSEAFPKKIKPMLATAIDKPFNDKHWVFEIKWDGVQSIFFFHKTKRILEIKSRSDKTITHRYPELIEPLNSAIKCQESIVLDGEIVVLDKEGMPSFQNHQRRMNVDNKADIEKLSREIPATYYIFDILYLDGKTYRIRLSSKKEYSFSGG